MRDQTRRPGDDRPAITRIVAALVVGGALTIAGVVRSSAALTIAGVVLLFICSTATRVWYFRRRR
ncbi:hypothetical protein [Cellulomonas sp. Y8]|uniref:hypothetical protein n=1 Tax=Cellulomonas sp. Y8 TaxID=2591145 RepID=UPI003D74358D